jgi:hypothetical protein
MFGEIKEKLITKSYNSYNPYNYNSFYGLFDNSTGNIIGEMQKYDLANEIINNAPVQTVLKQQRDILNQCELQALETNIKGQDMQTTYQPALDILKILNNPATYPAPKHWNDIVKGIYEIYHTTGIVALILKEGKTRIIKNIEIANSVQYTNIGRDITYIISNTNGKNSIQGLQEFKYDNTLKVYCNKNDIAIIFGNYDVNTCSYKSPLSHIATDILWHNIIKRGVLQFHQNSCQPSSIITFNYKNPEIKNPEIGYEGNKKDIKILLDEVKTQLKGNSNVGKTIVLSDPDIAVDVKPLSIIQDANNIEKQLAMTTKAIYSAFSGANINVIEGISEYSNNRMIGEQTFYDKTIAGFNDIILDDLNSFLKKWLAFAGEGKLSEAKQRDGIYLKLDTNEIPFYKKIKEDIIFKLGTDQFITRQEARTLLKTSNEMYAGLEELPPAYDGFIGVKQNNLQ